MSTFCVMIQEELLVATCPLKQGRCYWQHTKTNSCKYSVADADDLTVEEFCQRTGRELPSEEERLAIYEQLKATLRP